MFSNLLFLFGNLRFVRSCEVCTGVSEGNIVFRKILVDFLVFLIDSYMDDNKPAIPGLDGFPEKRFYKILLNEHVYHIGNIID